MARQISPRFPEIFSRPEVQLNLIAQNNVTLNELSINISAGEAKEIEAAAEPVRARVRDMLAKYRPTLGNGNGDVEKKVVDVAVESVEPPIERRPGEEKKPAFWAQFVGDMERAVTKETAIFVVSTIVNETIGGGRGQQAIVAFKGSEPILVSGVLAVIEKLCGGPAGWQLLQKKAGIQPGAAHEFNRVTRHRIPKQRPGKQSRRQGGIPPTPVPSGVYYIPD